MPAPTSLADKFWKRIPRDADPSVCWIWPSGRQPYPQLQHRGKQPLAHRVAYELVKGPIPEGLTLDHLCRNTRCVNPHHLEAVTSRVNTLRGFSPSATNARKTHCKRGHPFNDENTYRAPNGARHCRACHAVHARASRNRQAAAA